MRGVARRRRSRLLPLGGLALVLLVVASACGGVSSEDATRSPRLQHIHGLGLNPADRSLYLATHAGLFRIVPDSQEVERVGEGRLDTMGFAVVGPDRFVGSGHPDPRDGLPEMLGLIGSWDGGRSWSSLSLPGAADFHAIRARGRRLVGYDAGSGRLMVSDDAGRTGHFSRTPAGLTDVVIDPAGSDRLVAASPTGLLRTSDAGRTWSHLPGTGVALAWPAPSSLYAFTDDGGVSMSADAGASWSSRAGLPGEPAAVTAAAENVLIVALHDGTFANSSDGGRSWKRGPWS